MTDRELLELAENSELKIALAPIPESILAEIRRAEREKCAVVAWNHYMDRCKLNGISPTVFAGWCSAAAIRALKGQP